MGQFLSEPFFTAQFGQIFENGDDGSVVNDREKVHPVGILIIWTFQPPIFVERVSTLDHFRRHIHQWKHNAEKPRLVVCEVLPYALDLVHVYFYLIFLCLIRGFGVLGFWGFGVF